MKEIHKQVHFLHRGVQPSAQDRSKHVRCCRIKAKYSQEDGVTSTGNLTSNPMTLDQDGEPCSCLHLYCWKLEVAFIKL